MNREFLQKEIRLLPKERGILPAWPFVRAFPKRSPIKQAFLNEENNTLTLMQFLEKYYSKPGASFEDIRKFIKWCCFDINIIERKVLKELFLMNSTNDRRENERNRRILLERANEKDYVAIRRRFIITRKQLMQLERRYYKSLANIPRFRTLLFQISALQGGTQVLSLRELEPYFNGDAKILFYLLKQMRTIKGFHYNASISSFIITSKL